jgi:hypothetical protein
MADGGLTPDLAAVNGALVESWTLSLHDKPPRTLTHYLDEVWRFARWLTDHSRPAAAPGDLLAVERKDVEAWLALVRHWDILSASAACQNADSVPGPAAIELRYATAVALALVTRSCHSSQSRA